MSYARLEQEDGLQWPCWDESHPGELFLHSRLWERPVLGPRAPFHVLHDDPPVDQLDADFPYRLTTGRRLAEYNTGVQTGGYASPTRRGESSDLAPEDATRLGLANGDLVRVTSRRGSLEVPIQIDPALRPGLTFMTFHFPEEVATNLLTIDATDPVSGTAEFKAAAIRIEPLGRLSDPLHQRRRRSPSSWGRAEWTSRSTARNRPTRNGRPSTVCSAPPPAAGRAERATSRVTGAPAAAVARRATSAISCCLPFMPSRSRRLGERGRPQLHLPAPDRAARRCLGRGDLLPSLRDGSPPADGGACLRRPRLPAARRREALRAAHEEELGPAGEPKSSGGGTWMRSPCLGLCERAPAALVVHAGAVRQTATLGPVADATAIARALEGDTTELFTARAGGAPRDAAPVGAAGGQRPDSSCCRGSEPSIRGVSTPIAGRAAIARWPARSSSDPPA